MRGEPPDVRKSVLDKACAQDAELRREVEVLLAADADPLHLESLAARPLRGATTETRRASDAGDVQTLPQRIGAYHIKRRIASGGMGTVYEATQEHPRRTVAVKVMRRGITSRSALRRAC